MSVASWHYIAEEFSSKTAHQQEFASNVLPIPFGWHNDLHRSHFPYIYKNGAHSFLAIVLAEVAFEANITIFEGLLKQPGMP